MKNPKEKITQEPIPRLSRRVQFSEYKKYAIEGLLSNPEITKSKFLCDGEIGEEIEKAIVNKASRVARLCVQQDIEEVEFEGIPEVQRKLYRKKLNT